MTVPTPQEAAERAALDVFLATTLPNRQVPILEAARRDAAETMLHGEALWLATLGYLIILEVIGQSVGRPNSTLPRGNSTERFVAGAQEFAARPVSPYDARALYGLRCSLAHEYGLLSANSNTRHIFALRQVGPLVKHPVAAWASVPDPGDPSKRVWPTAMPQNETWINVREVGVFVEELIANLRTEHSAGNVALAPGLTHLELRNKSQFLLT